MKKFNKYLTLGAVAFVSAGFAASCDTSKDNDFVAEYEGAPGIYFSTTENSYLELQEDQNTITYKVYRDVAGEAVTVAVEVTPLDEYDVDDIYTFPSSVTFEAGSKVADYVIGYDISKAEMGVEQEYELVLDTEPTPFSTNTVVLTLVNPAPWTYLGVGEYYDWFWGVSDTSYGTNVEFYQHGLNPNIYRVSNPYVALNGENSYFEFIVLQPGYEFLGETITQTDLVGWSMVYCEFESSYADDMYFVFPGYFSNYPTQASWRNNRVVLYQENGMPGYITLAGIYYMFEAQAGADYTNDPSVEIIFPGFVIQDTSVEVAYEGILKGNDQNETVLLNVELGEDITIARAAVAPGKNSDQLVNAIINGTANFTEFSASGNVKVPFGNNNQTGDYVAAVVGYVDDEAKNSDAVTFFYISSESDYDPNEGWKSLGYVQYTDGFMCSNVFLQDPPVTYYVEIQENEKTAGLYRLVNPYGPGSIWLDGEYNPYTATYVVCDASDPKHVYLPANEQSLTIPYNDGSYDDFEQTFSEAGYYIASGLTQAEIEAEEVYGTLDNGKITFPARTLLMYITNYTATGSVVDQYTGYYYANIVLDYDSYQASQGKQPYLLDANGDLVAPFLIDLNTITSKAPAMAANTVVKSFASPQIQKVKDALKVNRLLEKKNREAMEKQAGKSGKNFTSLETVNKINKVKRHH
ncbi:MAG: hypothetical protein J1F43_05805 [Muribaculaceae bacterium]|nr:hypothetical protein [Muribaculaceae bacterium]